MALAFVQESKNAWKEKVPDYAAIEFALRKALHEGGIALRLEPRNLTVRYFVASFQDKLFRLTSERASSP